MANDVDSKWPVWLNKYYEIGGAITVSLAIVLFLLFGFLAIVDSTDEKKYTDYDYVELNVPDVSNMNKLLSQKKSSDSLFVMIYKQNISLVDSIKIVNAKLKKVNFDNVYTENRIKIFASIISIIIAVVGFFGFKSLNDIREHTIKNAQFDAMKTARDTAKDTARDVLTNEYVAQKFDESFKRVGLLYEESINNVMRKNNELEKRILNLENIQDAQRDEETDSGLSSKANDSQSSDDIELPDQLDEA